MKRLLCSLALAGLLTTGAALAQDSAPPDQSAPPPPPPGQSDMGPMGGGHGHRGMMSPDARLAHMTKRYNLTTDQQNQIKPILQDEQQQMMSMHSDTSMSRQDKMAKGQTLRQDTNQKIEAILTDPQRQKFDADQQRMESRRASHMQQMQNGQGQDQGGAPPPPPPPSDSPQ